MFGCASNICGSSPRTVGDKPVSAISTRFPADTFLIARQPKSGTLLWATTQKLHNTRTGAEFTFPNGGCACKQMAWSADQKRLLVVGETDAYVLEADSLRFVHHLNNSVAWWQGSHYAYIDYTMDAPRIVSSANKPIAVLRNIEGIYAADPQNGYLLCGTLLPRELNHAERGPAYLLQICKLTSRDRLRRIRTLGRTYFDPGSSGVPGRFGMGKDQRVVFNYPHGGEALYTLQMAEGQQIRSLFMRNGEDSLESIQGPFVGENTLFGIVGLAAVSGSPCREQYLYRISGKKTTLQKIGLDVAFAYYDPIRHAIGLGYKSKTGVLVRYVSELLTQ